MGIFITMEEKFEDVMLGEVFILYPNSTLLYEKTDETEAKSLDADFGIILAKEDKVITINNT